tara:strand:+ start:32890 stop:34293 length:1404 start_codon:yes stop_codon:yes gene_type:complete
MASPVIQIKRGAFANLPGLQVGEPALTTDTFELYVGFNSTTGGNKFFGSHRYWTREAATTGSSVKVVEGTNNGTNSVALKSPDTLAGDLTLTLPGTDASTSGQVLQSDASGVLSFGDAQVANIDIDGATDIGADLVDADLFIVDDGASGTNRKTAASRIKSYVLGGASGASFTEVVVGSAVTINSTGIDIASGIVTTATLDADNATIDSLTITSGTAITSIDTDITSVSGSDDTLASAKAIKTYVDAQLTAEDLDIAGDSGTGAVDLDSQSLTVAGTANEVETSASGQTITVGLPAAVVVTTSLDVPTVEATNLKAKDGTTAITITDSTGAVACAQNLTVGGNLIVNGSTTQVNTSQTTIEDQLLELGMVDGSAPTSDLNVDIGLVLNYFNVSAKKAAIYWDDSSSRIVVSADVTENTGVITNNTSGTLELGSLYVNGCTGSAVEVIGCDSGTVVITNATIDGGTFT